MPSTALVSASDDLSEVVDDFDVAAIVTGSAGLGLGLMGAEMAADEARAQLSGQRSEVRTAGDIGARAGVAVALNLIRNNADLKRDYPVLDVLLVFASFGAASSATLRGIEVVLDWLSDAIETSSSNSPQTRRSAPTATSPGSRSPSATPAARSSGSTRSTRASSSSSGASKMVETAG